MVSDKLSNILPTGKGLKPPGLENSNTFHLSRNFNSTDRSIKEFGAIVRFWG